MITGTLKLSLQIEDVVEALQRSSVVRAEPELELTIEGTASGLSFKTLFRLLTRSPRTTVIIRVHTYPRYKNKDRPDISSLQHIAAFTVQPLP